MSLKHGFGSLFGGMHTEFQAIASDEIASIQVKLSPNPAEDYLLIEMDRPFLKDLPIAVYSVDGKAIPVLWILGENNTLLLETHQLHSGAYLVQIKTETGETVSRKFIKQ